MNRESDFREAFVGQDGTRKNQLKKISNWIHNYIEYEKDRKSASKICWVFGPDKIGKTWTIKWCLDEYDRGIYKTLTTDDCGTCIDELVDWFLKDIVNSDDFESGRSDTFYRLLYASTDKSKNMAERLLGLRDLLELRVTNVSKTARIVILEHACKDFHSVSQLREALSEKGLLVIWEREKLPKYDLHNRSLSEAKASASYLDDNIYVSALSLEEACQLITHGNHGECKDISDATDKPWLGPEGPERFFKCNDLFEELIPEEVGCHPFLLKQVCKKICQKIEQKLYKRADAGIPEDWNGRKYSRKAFLKRCISEADLKDILDHYIRRHIEFIKWYDGNLFANLQIISRRPHTAESENNLILDDLENWGLIIRKGNEFVVPRIVRQYFEKKATTDGGSVMIDERTNRRLQRLEQLIEDLEAQQFAAEQAIMYTPNLMDKQKYQHELEDILKKIRGYEQEYARLLHEVPFEHVISANDAGDLLAIIQKASEQMEAFVREKNQSTSNVKLLTEKVEEIQQILQAPKETAAAKVKMFIGIIPTLLGLEVELDIRDVIHEPLRTIKDWFRKNMQK